MDAFLQEISVSAISFNFISIRNARNQRLKARDYICNILVQVQVEEGDLRLPYGRCQSVPV